jgi:FRG domain
MIKGTQISSVHGFLRAIQAKKDEWESCDDCYLQLWFRGQPNAKYQLVPGLYRFDERLEVDEGTYRHDFRLKSHPYLQHMRGTTDWEQYALMQHYGLCTRLLDWTEGALIALQFAVLGRPVKSDVAVWMIDPLWVNEYLHGAAVLYREDSEVCRAYVPEIWKEKDLPEKPLAIEIPYNSPRITAQRGIFTVHGKNRTPLDKVLMASEKARCCQYIVPKEYVLAVRRQLRTAGITDTVIYPDLQGLCEELWQTWVAERVVEPE